MIFDCCHQVSHPDIRLSTLNLHFAFLHQNIVFVQHEDKSVSRIHPKMSPHGDRNCGLKPFGNLRISENLHVRIFEPRSNKNV